MPSSLASDGPPSRSVRALSWSANSPDSQPHPNRTPNVSFIEPIDGKAIDTPGGGEGLALVPFAAQVRHRQSDTLQVECSRER